MVVLGALVTLTEPNVKGKTLLVVYVCCVKLSERRGRDTPFIKMSIIQYTRSARRVLFHSRKPEVAFQKIRSYETQLTACFLLCCWATDTRIVFTINSHQGMSVECKTFTKELTITAPVSFTWSSDTFMCQN